MYLGRREIYKQVWLAKCCKIQQQISLIHSTLKITINQQIYIIPSTSILYPTNQTHSAKSRSHSTIQYQYHIQQINITFNNSISVSHSTNQYHVQRFNISITFNKSISHLTIQYQYHIQQINITFNVIYSGEAKHSNRSCYANLHFTIV